MKKLVLLSLLLCVVFTVTLFSVVQASSTFSTPPRVVAGLDNCNLPCWREINPRNTGVAQAHIVLASNGYTLHSVEERFSMRTYDPVDPALSCAIGLSYNGAQVTNITLADCDGVYVGDFMAVLGTPDSVLSPGNALAFRNGAVVVSTNAGCGESISPRSEVQAVYLRSSTQLATAQYPWHGFIDRDLYSTIVPDMPECV